MIGWLLALAVGGEIGGTVVDSEGAPLDGALVLAYDIRLRYELDYADSSGAFLIDELKPGLRRVRIIPPDEVNAVEMYYDLGGSLCDAVPIEDTTEPVGLGVVVVPAGGVVAGQVLGPDGLPIEGLEISSRPAESSATALPRSGFTDAFGRFEVRGIPVLADGPLWVFEVEGEGIPDQFLGEAFLAEDGEVFGVGVGDVVDLGSWTLRPGGTLAGSVIGPSGPVLEGEVFAVTTGLPVSAPLVGGNFEITALAPGEAQVWVEAPGLAATWYPDAPGPGVTVPVEDDVRVDGLGIRAAAESVLRGRFTGIDSFDGSQITVVNALRTLTITVELEPDGAFEVRGMPAGAWTLELDPAEGLDVVDGPLLDDQGNVRVFDLAVGRTLDVGNTPVPRGAVIEGTVSDRETGEGVYGARVTVENVNTSSSSVVLTGRGGRYRAAGLPAGVYRMSAEYSPYCDEDPDWTTRHYPDQRNSVLTGSISLAPGQVGLWSPRLPQDRDHDAMGDEWERRYGLRVGVDDAFEDLDGDGFVNLDEYLLGTNPAGTDGVACGCSENGASWLLFWMPVLWGRRRVTPA